MLEAIRRSAESWGVKILFGLIIIVFVFWGVGSYQGNRTQVVAMVNERPILVGNFSQSVSRAMEQFREQNPTVTPEDLKALGFKEQVLWQLITDELLLEEAERMRIAASPAEIAAQIRSFPAFSAEQGFDKERYRDILASQGMTPTQFEQQIRSSIVQSKLRYYATLPAQVNEAQAHDLFSYAWEQRSIDYLLIEADNFAETVEVSEEDIAAFYEENKERFKLPVRMQLAYLAFTPEALSGQVQVSDAEIKAYYDTNKATYSEDKKVRASHIYIGVNDDAPADVEAAAKARIEELMEQARQGASFAELAKEHSQDPSAEQGGDLGWIGRGEMVEPFEEAVYNTAPGEISGPVRSPFGWHAVMVREVREARQKPLEEVQDEIRQLLARDKAADTLTDLLDQGLELAISGMSLDAVAKDLGLQLEKTDLLSRDQGTSLLGLSDQSLETLFAMQAGEVTDMPLATNKGYIIAEITDRRPAEYEPLEAVRQSVIESIRRDKALELARAEAEELLVTIAKDGLTPELEGELKSSDLFDRRGMVPELGMNPELNQAVFSAKPDQWLDKPFAFGDGYVLARLKAVEQPSEERWNTEKNDWLSFLQQGIRNELYQAYVENLKEKAKIEVVSPEYLN
jgi:peptidyl-prolyl cis-trans isomerase D